MAWGGQGNRDKNHVTNAWAANQVLVPILTQIRGAALPRITAYKLFLSGSRSNLIPGLGPSFFSKLLYFFGPKPSPTQLPPYAQPPCYVVDNQVLKSLTLLTGLPFMQAATPGGYQAACETIDAMATMLQCSAQDLEERLFDRHRGHWRRYRNLHLANYQRQNYVLTMHAAFPNIPVREF